MGYTAKDNWIHLYEGTLIEITSPDYKSAERWVEILRHPQSDDEHTYLSLVIYRSKKGKKGEKKIDHPIHGASVVGLEQGAVGSILGRGNRYIALIMKSSILRFQMDEQTCTTLYELLTKTLRHNSWRVYTKGPNACHCDMALHLNSHFISSSKLTPLHLHKYWSLADVCTVSQNGRMVSFTVFNLDMTDQKTGYREFPLKNEETAIRCKTEVEALLAKLSPSGSNTYTTGQPLSSTPYVRSNSLDGFSPLTHRRTSDQENRFSGFYVNITTPQTSPEYTNISQQSTATVNYPFSQKPPLPPKSVKPVVELPKSESEVCGDLAPPVPIRDSVTPQPRRDFCHSMSMEEGQNRWDAFLIEFGVQDEITKIKRDDRYAKRGIIKSDKRITRSDRTSIVPKRPTQRPIKTDEYSSGDQQSGSSSSLYTFLFQVWNSQEILADTLGMALSTWQNFVVYFEFYNRDGPSLMPNDWKSLAERIGMSPIDIQVIDNYGRRFNQCASAIVMLFWQENTKDLKEDYSRPVLLQILRDLEREDLIDVVTGADQASQ